MFFLRRHGYWLFLLCFIAALIGAPDQQATVRIRLADGFDQPVGKPDGENYYKSRGFRARYHLGEDWNGLGGGNSDLGKPVYAVAHGYVMLARDMRSSWGNLVILRHIFLENDKLQIVDSVYAHMDTILIHEGQQVTRGQQVGTIGTDHGMYPAHLHFEIRKNLTIGSNESAAAKDLTNYYAPSVFIGPRRKLPGGNRSEPIPLNTFALPNQPASTVAKPSATPTSVLKTPTPAPKRKEGFRVNRYDDL